MNKCHTPLNWQNDTTPAINDTNLNYMDGCIETIDDRVVAMDTTKANVTDLETALEDWDVDNSTGDVTLTYKNGQTEIKHTNLSKIALNAHVIHDPEDPHYQQMEITYPDGTKDYIDFSSFVTNIELVDSPEIHFTHNDDGTTSGSIINGSITANKLQPNFLADCQSAANTASTAATSANASRLESEGWAVGKQDGVDVPSTSPYYHNNAKYFAEYAGGNALSALTDVQLSDVEDGQELLYNGTLNKWVNGAGVQFATLPVTNLTAVAGDSQVTLSWTNPEDVTLGGTTVAELELIKVYRDGALVERALLSTYTDTGLVNGQTYVYTVVAETTKGVESAVATISATPVAAGLSITLNGAKNDVIAVYDEEDTLIDTITFESGETSGLLVLDDAYIGQTLKFESSVAKGTTDATKTQNYVQRTEITEGMTVINVMPEGALYWYGNEIVSVTGGWRNPNDNLITSDTQEKFDCHSNNGIRIVTKGTNALYTKADDRNASVKRVYATWYTTNTINVAAYSKLKCLTNRIQAQGTTAYRDHFGIVSPDINNKALGELTISNVWYNSVGTQIMEMAVSEMTITNGYIFSWAIVSSGIIEKNVSAIWLEKSTPVTLTLEGAKEDNITIKQNGATVATCIFASGATSGTVTLDVPADGSDVEYTFESTVAKDTTSGTSNYTKTVNLNKTTAIVKIMTDGAVYWYGNECGELFQTSLIKQSGLNRTKALAAITRNTNSIQINVNGDVSVACAHKSINLNGYSKLHAIQTNSYAQEHDVIQVFVSDTINDEFIVIDSDYFRNYSGDQKSRIDLNLTATGSKYLIVQLFTTSPNTQASTTISAIWLE